MNEVYLGLGSNRGDRKAHIREALARLADGPLQLEAVSSVFESEPVGYEDQPCFWNLVVRGRAALAPAGLLDAVKRIERGLGRTASFRNAPRVIDIDILLYADRIVRTEHLEVPHPRMLERAFVLKPLVELNGELRHPVTGRKLSEHLSVAATSLDWAVPLFPGSRLVQAAGGRS